VRGRAISDGVEVDDNVLGVGGVDAVDGMTARNFDPTPPNPHRFR
jgi:hypothetical protein